MSFNIFHATKPPATIARITNSPLKNLNTVEIVELAYFTSDELPDLVLDLDPIDITSS